ncbi:Protein of unknown function [Pyronema omphalodes CBS 100304]|uniref:Uncharacterized protein n=1 Tax=Pyronema omphalodes (strain CBS 100304) TaxID=1076935 RepID=U4L775_PYROM|nr:Protein of unknown function [Pyronema omphalodes CBS 100304]
MKEMVKMGRGTMMGIWGIWRVMGMRRLMMRGLLGAFVVGGRRMDRWYNVNPVPSGSIFGVSVIPKNHFHKSLYVPFAPIIRHSNGGRPGVPEILGRCRGIVGNLLG